jgi:subtilisin family serine protease
MNRLSGRIVRRGIFLALLAALPLPALARPADRPGPVAAKQQALFERLNVAEAWKITRGDPKVLVGVIDSGFDFYHPDLKGQLIPGYYYPGGYHTEFYENVAHGTLVSSIIVARDDNPAGMVGLAPRCRVLTASQGMIEHRLVKMQRAFFQKNPKATLADLQKEMMKQPETLKKFAQDWVHFQVDGAANAIRYLVDRGVKVINFSGGLKRSLCPSAEKWKNLEGAFSYAAEKGVVIVLAAGNNAARWEDYPGSPETVIVAGATLLNDTRWEEELAVGGDQGQARVELREAAHGHGPRREAGRLRAARGAVLLVRRRADGLDEAAVQGEARGAGQRGDFLGGPDRLGPGGARLQRPAGARRQVRGQDRAAGVR